MTVRLDHPPPHATRSYGGVVRNAEGKVLLREPTNHYDGYVWTFAKGKPNKGETHEQAALREVREETGVDARITGEVPGWFRGNSGVTKMYLMELVEDHGDFEWETQSVRWASWDDALELVAKNTTEANRARDRAILELARRAAS